MKLFRLVSDYRWPIYIGGHLTMSIVACAVLVWVATRPDAPRPIEAYYEAAESWDVDEAVQDASRQLAGRCVTNCPRACRTTRACRDPSTYRWSTATASRLTDSPDS